MKNIVVFHARFRFPVKLICCVAFGQYLVIAVYLNLLLSFLTMFGMNITQ